MRTGDVPLIPTCRAHRTALGPRSRGGAEIPRRSAQGPRRRAPRPRWLSLLACLSCLLSSAGAAEAGGERSQRTSLSVSATVVPYVRLQLLEQDAVLVITPEDVRRGVVEVPVAARLGVRTNSDRGYILSFDVAAGLLRGGVVSGLGSPTLLGPRGGAVEMSSAGPIVATHELSFLFHLAPEARPGTYRWPVRVSAHAPRF